MANNGQDKLNVKYYKEIKCKAVDWLWYPYIPYGKLTIIQGDPGQGKSTLALNLAAIVSTGSNIPLTHTPINKNTVVYQNSEDGIEDTICPRLKSYGADLDKIAYIDETDIILAMDDERLDQVLEETGARLMILDPIQAYFKENTDMNRASGIRPIMNKLAKLALKHNCAIILIGHLSKAKGMNELYRGLGSIDITASARSVLLVSTMKENPKERIMAHIKSNLAPLGNSVVFRINSKEPIEWVRNSKLTAEQIVEAVPDVLHKIDRAKILIMEMLEDGEKPSAYIINECVKNGISERTIKTAKAKLNLYTIKRKGCWYWSVNKQNVNKTEEYIFGGDIYGYVVRVCLFYV